jgi:hypothetical protein
LGGQGVDEETQTEKILQVRMSSASAPIYHGAPSPPQH